MQDLWWLLGAAWELQWGITHLQERLVWLESRDSSELLDNPGLLQRPPQPQGECPALSRAPQCFCIPRCSKGIHRSPPGTSSSPRRPSTALPVSQRGQGAAPTLSRLGGLREPRAPSPGPAAAREEPPDAAASGAKQLRQHKSTVTAPERLSPGVRKKYKLVSFSLPYAPLQLWAAR